MNTTESQKNALSEAVKKDFFYSEKVWTYFIASLIERSKNKGKYLNRFINTDSCKTEKPDFTKNSYGDPSNTFWFESQPLPPRQGTAKNSEGNTHLDLAFGNIMKRRGTEGGIEYNETGGPVCFIESKFLSDCSLDISYDPFRNQLIRIIENLLCFQSTNNDLPDYICFTLLTPRAFKKNPFSRLYGYKYFDYHKKENIYKDIEKCKIDKRNTPEWKYPDNIVERIMKLKLNWVTYEEILEDLIKENLIPDIKLSTIENLSGKSNNLSESHIDLLCISNELKKLFKKAINEEITNKFNET